MEFFTLPLDDIMELGPGSSSDFASSSSNEAAFEQLLRLAASHSLRQSASSLDADHAPAKAGDPVAADIELRAYQIFLQRGAAHGHDIDDWLTAERQVLAGLKKDTLRVALAFGLQK